jgi:hypothetical protein
LLSSFAWAFTRPGFRRFAEWVTALAINLEEHTITQSVTAIERIADWKAPETFVEYGSWRPDYMTDARRSFGEANRIYKLQYVYYFDLYTRTDYR